MLKNFSFIKLIYLYLFSALGLILVIMGSVKLIDLSLKILIFKEAEKTEIYNFPPPLMPIPVLEKIKTNGTFNKEEKQLFEDWSTRYKNWLEQQKKINLILARRQKEASNSISLILVGAPLYLYHWRILRKVLEI